MEGSRAAPQPYLGLVLEKLRRVSPGADRSGLLGPGVAEAALGRKPQTLALGSEPQWSEVPMSVFTCRRAPACVPGSSQVRRMLGRFFVWWKGTRR